jgi:hypothetical protein
MKPADLDVFSKLEELRAFMSSRPFNACRLVHYAGLGTPNAIDVELADIEAQVTGCLGEGFLVAWNTNANRLFLCVQEPDCPLPAWDKVFREESVVDEDAILREAGLKDAT